MEIFTEREQAQIVHAVAYADAFSDAGAPGHTHFLLIAKMAKNLGEILGEINAADTANPVHPLLQHLDESVEIITRQIAQRGISPGLLVESTRGEEQLHAILASIFTDAVENDELDWEQLMALCHVAILQLNHPEIWEG